jgi:hypothetical protein
VAGRGESLSKTNNENQKSPDFWFFRVPKHIARPEKPKNGIDLIQV